jgi:hypothetical protein
MSCVSRSEKSKAVLSLLFLFPPLLSENENFSLVGRSVHLHVLLSGDASQ